MLQSSAPKAERHSTAIRPEPHKVRRLVVRNTRTTAYECPQVPIGPRHGICHWLRGKSRGASQSYAIGWVGALTKQITMTPRGSSHASWAAVGATKLGDGRYAWSPRLRQDMPCRRRRQYCRIRMSSAACLRHTSNYNLFIPVVSSQLLSVR